MNNLNIDYNVNVTPILAEYNNTNQGSFPLINADDNTMNSLVNIRGYGKFDPAPQYPQSQNYGNALSEIKPVTDVIYQQEFGNLYQTPIGAVELEKSWNKNMNTNLKLPGNNLGGVKSNYEYYDDYQRYAYNVTRKSDPYILPFYFSKINVNFIQNEVIKIVEKERGIKINTEQDIEGLLEIMIGNYTILPTSQGIIGNNSCATKPSEDKNTYFTNILAKLNQQTIQQYVKLVLSTLNMTEYYIKDISNLPMPLSQPVTTDNKGKNQLGFVGFFEDNHKFTKAIDSFNTRNVLPGKIDSIKFGN